MKNPPFFTDDTIVFGLLMFLLALVFYTSTFKGGFWKKFYVVFPSLLMCYLLPSIFSSLNIIAPEWNEVGANGEVVTKTSSIYFIASRYLLPAALVLMTLSIDLKAMFKLGPKALIMFFTGTVGVIIVVANIWMAVLLFGIDRKDKVDKWFKADNRSIDELKEKVTAYADNIKRNPSLTDLIVILGIAFTAVGLSHWGSNSISSLLKSSFPIVNDPTSFVSTFGDRFFWMVTIATVLGIALSYTKLKEYEGAGASKIGSVFIYILVASIGMKMDLGSVLSNPGLLVVGLVWMAVHVSLLIVVAKIIKAPYFFLAVGSQANIGGAASAPIVASAFHPSLASVGVLLAVFGYVIGTYGALIAAFLMEIVAKQ